MNYYAYLINSGPLYYHGTMDKISVISSPYGRDVIGQAECIGQDNDGVAMWKLVVGGLDMPDEFCVVDGEFMPVT